MVITLHTPRSAKELTTDLHNVSERLHQLFNQKRPGDVERDKEIEIDLHELTLISHRLMLKFIHSLEEDAKYVALNKRSIDMLKDILDDIKKSKKEGIREKKYLKWISKVTKKKVENEHKTAMKQAETKRKEELKNQQK